MSVVWATAQPLREELGGFNAELADIQEEEIVYPRLSPLKPSGSQQPRRTSETFVEDEISSSTESPNSTIYLSDASNKPHVEGSRYTSSAPVSEQTNFFHTFRMHRPVQGQVPSSDPESFFSGTRTASWQSRRDGRPSSRNSVPLAWIATNPLRPRSPLSRPGSAVVSRNRDHSHGGSKVIGDTGCPAYFNGFVDNNASARPRDLTGQVFRLCTHPIARGGFADVWIATWAGIKVAVKELRLSTENEEAKKKLRKRLRRELRVWRELCHDHVLPLYGTTSGFGPNISMVCPWMENGTLNGYLKRHGTNLSLSARFKLLCEIAAGLRYLHSRNVIHGDLTGSNILIDGSGRARLSDFGLSIILAEFQGTSYYTSSIRGAVRYAAFEVYAVSETEPSPSVRISTYSDIYSFGSVILQMLSGKVPYHYLKNDPMVIWELYNGVTPQRPIGGWITDDHWRFINQCWNKDPHNRPTVHDAIKYVQRCYDESCAHYVPM